jgi:hypothetical protein
MNLPVRVLSYLFQGLFLAGLADAHAADRLAVFGELNGLRTRLPLPSILHRAGGRTGSSDRRAMLSP